MSNADQAREDGEAAARLTLAAQSIDGRAAWACNVA